MTLCAFCRNDNATNEHPYDGNSDFVFIMCDDCDKRYKKHKQLGPKYVICNCDPNNPKELSLEMAESEIKQGTVFRGTISLEEANRIKESLKPIYPVIIKEDDKDVKKEYVRKVSKKQKRSFPTGY